MKYIYFGSAKFSSTVLEALCRAKILPILVVTQPDRPKGRHLVMTPTLVGKYARENNLPILKPDSLKTAGLVDKIKSLQPDFLVAADYGKILPQSLLDCAAIMPLAVHPSLLPIYRGASPINQALLNGDRQTGVTLFKMAQTMDSGPIVAQKKYDILEADDVISLSDKLAGLGAQLLIDVLQGGRINLQAQDERKVTFTAKLKKEDGLINWEKSAVDIQNLIRAVCSWPVAYTFYNGKRVQVLGAKSANSEFYLEGGVIRDIKEDGVYVTTRCGLLCLKTVKPEGKPAMEALAFAHGHGLKAGDKFSNHG